jgi:signal transduction histidine kinase
VDLRTEISATYALSPAVALNAFRILQEALQNVLKHSGASRAIVDIHFNATGLRIRIADDGRFRPPDPDALEGSGLGNMRKRAEEVNGDVSIDGTSTGTTVELHVPIP